MGHHPVGHLIYFIAKFLSGKQIDMDDMDMFGQKKSVQPPGTRKPSGFFWASTAPIYPPMASWIGTFCAQDHPLAPAARKGHGTASALDGSFVSENKGRPTGGK